MNNDSEQSDWLLPYVAGVVDNHFNLVVTLSEASSRAVGVRVQPTVRYKFEQDATQRVLNQYCHKIGVDPRMNKKDTTYGQYEFVIGRRDDIKTFLQPLQPYLVVRDAAVELLIDNIIPALNSGAHGEKESFLQLVQTIDTFRNKAGRANRSKYDYDYFKQKWNLSNT